MKTDLFPLNEQALNKLKLMTGTVLKRTEHTAALWSSPCWTAWYSSIAEKFYDPPLNEQLYDPPLAVKLDDIFLAEQLDPPFAEHLDDPVFAEQPNDPQ